jgi:hypothetical protein
VRADIRAAEEAVLADVAEGDRAGFLNALTTLTRSR